MDILDSFKTDNIYLFFTLYLQPLQLGSFEVSLIFLYNITFKMLNEKDYIKKVNFD
jgi:hypothetical protein